MGQTIAEKIFASHSGNETVKPGDMLFAKVDRILGTDPTVPLSKMILKRMGVDKVFDPSKIVLVNDHFVPAKDIKSAQLAKEMREFAQEQNVKDYFEVGRSGICHTVGPEAGLVKPGDLVIGADSHTCAWGFVGALGTGVGSTDMAAAWALDELWFRVPETIRVDVNGELQPWVCAKDVILKLISIIGVEGALYDVLEYHGSTVENLSMDGRFTLSNMAIEAGGKGGICPADDTTMEYMEMVGVKDAQPMDSDKDAVFKQTVTIDGGALRPQVAKPFSPDNVVGVEETAGVHIDQVVIGTCTNGRLEDFETTYEIIKGKEVHPSVRLILIPSSQKIFMELTDRGYVSEFIRAGAAITPPSCGPCIGGHMGVLAAGEVGLFTTNRNFVGRTGHPEARTYLSGPAVAAASAIAGEIVPPPEL